MVDLKKIKAFAFDVDGVLTDGLMLAMPGGDLLRQFDAKDAFGIRMASLNGYHLAVITGAKSLSIKERLSYCGIPEEDIYQRSRIKMKDFAVFCGKYGLQPDEVMFFGDDIPDIPVMEACIGVAPADAVPEAKAAAKIVAEQGGGRGAVRHVIESVMRAQGTWSWENSARNYEKVF